MSGPHAKALSSVWAGKKGILRELLNNYDGKFNARAHTEQFDQAAHDEKRNAIAHLKGSESSSEVDEIERNLMWDHGKALVIAGWSQIESHISPGTFLDQKRAVEEYRRDSKANTQTVTTRQPETSSGSSTDNHRGVTPHGGDGSQPSKDHWHWEAKSIDMADLLVAARVLWEPKQRAGRKPGSDSCEQRLSYWESQNGYDWVRWFMQTGQFKASVLGWVASSRAVFPLYCYMYLGIYEH